MNLLHFGTSGRQLFGAYHAPPATVTGRGAALLCPPWGQEYLVSYRVFRQLAVRLSESGYHVLRFDYFGTGDSAGEREDGDLASWQLDAAMAADELRDMSGFPSLATFGLRLGAAVAWRLAAARRDVHTTVLWDPILSGAAYLRELRAAQMETDKWSLAPNRRAPSPVGALDLLGFPLTTSMRQSIEAVRTDSYAAPMTAQVKLFYSADVPEQAAVHGALQASGTSFRAETVRGQAAWRDDEAVGAGGVPVQLLERMVDILR